MLTIYGALNSRASRNVWLALELGLPFEHVPVIQASRLADPHAADAPLNTASASFLAISPAGLIPVIDDEGLVLSESLAINLYLARKAQHSPVAPQDAEEEARATMWTLWAATDCEPHGIDIITNLAIRSPEDRDTAAVERAVAALEPQFRRLAGALEAGAGYLVGQRFTVADLNVAEVVRYAHAATGPFDEQPVVADWLARCQARPAYLEMAERKRSEYLPEGWRNAYRPGGPAVRAR